MRRASFFAFCLLVSSTACASDVEEEDDDVWETHDELIGGSVNERRSEVGLVRSATGFCTGTLVATNVVLTAGHCSKATTFTIDGRHTFAVSSVRTWGGGGAGNDDLALLRLARHVSPSLAIAAELAESAPPAGAEITTFGYGCTTRGTRNGSGTKRSATYPYLSGKQHLCPGDSGGPTFHRGAVFRVNSGFSASQDIYAHVPPRRAEMLSLIRTWGGECVYGNGTYCGGNGTPGDRATLYRCTGRRASPLRTCANGCARMPPGTDDRCR